MKGEGSGLHRLRRRGAQCTLMAMLAQRLEPLGCELAASEEFGLPRGGQGGCGLCAAGVANLASAARQCARGHGRGAARDSGAGDVCVLVERGRADFFAELRALLLIGFGVSLGGMKRLFFRRTPNRFSTRHKC
jgi:hypothetical protein